MTGLRYLVPIILVALCLIALGTITAVSLFHQQASVTRVLQENVRSQRVAIELEECLLDLIALEDAHIESVQVLHERAAGLIRNLKVTSDQTEEIELFQQIHEAYESYLQRWRALPPITAANHESARQAATKYLETDVLKPCQEFEHYNIRRSDESTGHHERVLRQLAWGLAVVGGLGGVSGIVFGFGVARGLSRSIRRLHVQLRDAAGKIGPDLSEIVVTEQGHFQELHEEAERLTERIEQVVRDLHQREHEVLRAEQLAAVGQLAAGVAHEIRNPLTSIKMLVQAGQEDGEGMSNEDLRIIENEIRRMEKSLQTFLDFARPPLVQRTAVDLDAFIDDVFGLLRPRADQQQIALRKSIDPRVGTITADAEQFRQVLVNLCLNAFDAMPTGGILRVGVRLVDDRVEIEVADTGSGIAHAMFPKLFQPFSSTKDTGLGLGLVISKRIIQDHGGTMDATNRTDGGASFFISLPVEACHAHPLAHR